MPEQRHTDAVLESFAATQVVLREREARDRCWWDEMANCFHAESYVEISWFQGSGAEFTAQSKVMSESAVPSRHRLGPPTVRINESRGVVFLPAMVETYPTVQDLQCVMAAHCRLLYRVQQADGGWKIAGMQAIYERDELRPVLPSARLTVDPAELAQLRHPYRWLSWTLAQAGYSIDQDLVADDRPEAVSALHAEVFEWAGLNSPR
ncbi:nuclear transport factor 2 family protein [Mycobacterium intracellulare]|uniref:nuclear transport factor 2 family protein n=1 Tax=Mycobacterium intracellulare TaxID=1767 RepID=UPI001CDB0017|nr:nuclear transport factor 2 family protein [Mycobacterium intracellulare]MCA2255997.1 nuclear transport factor 2 family protein [Mycobacterium intracellulare]